MNSRVRTELNSIEAILIESVLNKNISLEYFTSNIDEYGRLLDSKKGIVRFNAKSIKSDEEDEDAKALYNVAKFCKLANTRDSLYMLLQLYSQNPNRFFIGIKNRPTFTANQYINAVVNSTN